MPDMSNCCLVLCQCQALSKDRSQRGVGGASDHPFGEQTCIYGTKVNYHRLENSGGNVHNSGEIEHVLDNLRVEIVIQHSA